MKKDHIYKLILWISFLFSLTLVVGCQPDKHKTKKINIGAILPLTGPLGFIGEYEKNAMELGLDQFDGPVMAKFIFEDCQVDTKSAVNAANKLVNIDNVSMAVTSPSFISWSVATILKNNHIPHFVFSFDPALPETDALVYRFFESSNVEAHGFIKFICERGLKKVVFLRHIHPDAEKSFQQNIQPVLSQQGVEVIDIPYPLGTKDFTNFIEKAKSKHADLVVIQAFGNLIPSIIKKIKELKLETPLLGDLNFMEIEDRNLKLVENIPFISLEYVFSDAYKKFKSDYQNKFGKKPLAPAAFCYDFANIINSFLNDNNGNFDSQTFHAYYLAGKFDTKIVKNFKIEPDGDIFLKPIFAKYISGKITRWP